MNQLADKIAEVEKGIGLEKRVLLIEDSPSQAAVTRLDLEKHGYQVSIAYDGPKGITAATTFGPDIIILDCNLPGLSGVEVCRQLKTQTETRHIPIIMFSAENKLSQMSSAYNAGADKYVTKDREGTNTLITLVDVFYRRLMREAARP